MNLIYIVLIVASISAKPGSLISFTLIEERSNEDNPLIRVTFPDGSSDFLILSKYENLEGHFIGHLQNEPSACVAMVNHPEHSEFTIMSNRIDHSTMYKWKHNDSDVVVIPELFSSGESDIMVEPNPAEESEFLDKIEPSNNNVTISEFVSIPDAAKLQIKVVYDKSILEKFGNKDKVIAYWNASAPHLQARYCQPSLGTKIKVERIGNFDYFDKEIVADGASLDIVKENAKELIGNADLVVYMAFDKEIFSQANSHVVGIATLGVVCTGWNDLKTSINEWRPLSVSYGALLAHEIGHNLGMLHDFDALHGGQNNPCNSKNNIMSYGSSMQTWSLCSKKDFQSYYARIKSKWCMEADIGDICNSTGGGGGIDIHEHSRLYTFYYICIVVILYLTIFLLLLYA